MLILDIFSVNFVVMRLFVLFVLIKRAGQKNKIKFVFELKYLKKHLIFIDSKISLLYIDKRKKITLQKDLLILNINI